MGVTKTDLFTEKENEIAIAAKALAHPARVAILNCLLKNKCLYKWRPGKRAWTGASNNQPASAGTQRCRDNTRYH